MANVGLLDDVPLWVMFPLGCLIILGCAELGFRLGRNFAKKASVKEGQSASVAVGAVLGFLAFMLAFTFNTAANRFQERRDIAIEDTNTIETTYLRTYMLPEPEGSQIRVMLGEYVDHRLGAISFSDIETGRSEELQGEIWKLATAAAAKQPTPITALLIHSLNDMIDVHTKRLTVVLHHRIAHWIWFSLFALMILGIGSMGYQGGLQAGARSRTMFALTLSFAIILLTTAALDRPGAGMFQVDQFAMETLRRSMADHK